MPRGRPDYDEHGVRYWKGEVADAYLQRVTPALGYTAVLFRGRHAPEPVDLRPDELTGFWSDVRIAVRAIRAVFAPCHVNYQLLGNATPHVHVHVVPRYLDDPSPGRRLGDSAWESARHLTDSELQSQVAALSRAAIEAASA
ncbi:MAG: HIT family protein [Gaiellaceae bacterium]